MDVVEQGDVVASAPQFGDALPPGVPDSHEHVDPVHEHDVGDSPRRSGSRSGTRDLTRTKVVLTPARDRGRRTMRPKLVRRRNIRIAEP